MATVITAVHQVGSDALLVEGTVNGVEVKAHGWLSALENHFGPEAYGTDGHRQPKAKARRMKKAERLAYFRRLLEEAAAPEKVHRPDLLGE